MCPFVYICFYLFCIYSMNMYIYIYSVYRVQYKKTSSIDNIWFPLSATVYAHAHTNRTPHGLISTCTTYNICLHIFWCVNYVEYLVSLLVVWLFDLWVAFVLSEGFLHSNRIHTHTRKHTYTSIYNISANFFKYMCFLICTFISIQPMHLNIYICL